MSEHRTAFGHVADADELTIRDAMDVLARGFRVIGDRAGCDSADADLARVKRAGAEVWTARTRDGRRELRTRDIRRHPGGHIPFDLTRREIFSWGTHFPLMRFVPRGERGNPRALFVLNGDLWRGASGFSSSSTSGHQATARAHATERGYPFVVIPFAALGGAALDIDSIRLLDSRPETDWTETRETVHLEEVPKWARTVSYQVERTAATLEEVPPDYRRTWRAPTDAEKADGASTYASYLDLLADADGIFRWTEGHKRPLAPDADGFFRWEVRQHRLGEALFSATRRETWRELPDAGSDCLVSLTNADNAENVARADADRAAYETELERGEGVRYPRSARDLDFELVKFCDANPYADARTRPHIASADGATCELCGRATEPVTRSRERRARYLSGFDTNESPAQYFLAEVRRGSGSTVAEAFDSLAPRAVHAALARGRDVRRQGDVFFIATDLTDADLAARGIVSRARLTQWTRNAKARAGEVGYLAAPTREALKRRASWTRRHWRETFRAHAERELAGRERLRRPDRDTRADAWRELRAERELLAMRETLGADTWRERSDLDARERELNRGRELGPGDRAGRPHSDRGARKRFAALRAKYAQDLADAERELRSTILGPSGARHYSRGYRDADTNARLVRDARGNSYVRAGRERYTRSGIVADRYAHADRITQARRKLDTLRATGARDSHGFTSRAHARDAYRTRWVKTPVALTLWRGAKVDAAKRFAPAALAGTPEHERARERIRDALAIYGTSHSATEVLRVRGGATYARGIARHAPDLARSGNPEHAPTPLGNGATWYLAVRNTVPRTRDNSTPRRRRRATASR